MPGPVFDAMTKHLLLEREVGGYEAESRAEPQLQRFYTAFAELLRVEPEEIAYVENATRAWDMAFYALPLKPGDRVITHASEYASNYLSFLQLSRRRGIEVDIAPSDSTGQIDVDAIAPLVTNRTKVIALTHVPTQGGLVNPAIEVGKVAKEHGLIYVLDACQSVGQMDVDISRIGCHILSGTGRKYLRGPRGTGFLYVSNTLLDHLDPPLIDLHSAKWTSPSSYEFSRGARRFENWECNVAGKLGLAQAVEYALGIGLPGIADRVTALADRLRDRLACENEVQVHDLGSTKCGIVTFDKIGEVPGVLVQRLRDAGIYTSVSCKEYAQLDLGERGLDSLARASVHYFNTDHEIDLFCDTLMARKDMGRSSRSVPGCSEVSWVP